MSTINKGYLVTKNGKIVYAENWYDEIADYDLFNEGLHVFSNEYNHCSFGDGKEFKNLGSLFRSFLHDKQYNIKKLAESIKDELIEVSENFDEDIQTALKADKIGDISESNLIDLIEEWSEYYDIPAKVFSNSELFAENFPYYCCAIYRKCYSNAGDSYYSKVDDGTVDAVFWVDRTTVDSWGTAEEDRADMMTGIIKTFEDWANGNCYGISYRIWDEEKLCWTEEEHVGGFLGSDFYNLEKICEDALEDAAEIKELSEANELTGSHAFDQELNDGVLYERARIQAELDKQPKLFTDEELAECQNSK